eukprot:989373_1
MDTSHHQMTYLPIRVTFNHGISAQSYLICTDEWLLSTALNESDDTMLSTSHTIDVCAPLRVWYGDHESLYQLINLIYLHVIYGNFRCISYIKNPLYLTNIRTIFFIEKGGIILHMMTLFVLLILCI